MATNTTGADKRYDVIIIGGGIIGSSVAMHLAEAGVGSIALVDVDLGGRYSSSELNAGGVRASWGAPINIDLSLASIEFFEREAEEVGFDQKGYLWMYDAAGWGAVAPRLALQNSRGLGVRRLTPAEITDYCPHLDQLDGIAGATLSPRDGLISPNQLKMFYRQRARSLCSASGGSMAQLGYTYVTGIEPGPNGVVVRARRFHEFSPAGDTAIKAVLREATLEEETEEVRLAADIVVNATGAWAKRTAPLYGHEVPVIVRRRQISVAHARGVDLRPWGMFVDPSGVYFHRESTFILAGYAEPDTPDAFRWTYEGERWFVEHIWPVLGSRMSGCGAMKHRSGWSGLYGYTPDHSGILGRAPGHPRIIEAFAFTGRGVMQSWAAGRAVAELAVHERFETLDCTALRPERFDEGDLVRDETSDKLVI